MDSNEKEPKSTEPEARGLEVPDLVSDWRKNRPDLSWKPNMGHSLQPGPKIIGILTTLTYLSLAAGLVVIVYLWSAPRETHEVKAVVYVVGTPKDEDFSHVVLAVEAGSFVTLRYRGKKQLRQGQEVTLEATSNPIVPWSNYKFKDPPSE